VRDETTGWFQPCTVPDPFASHVARWSRLYMRWQFVHSAIMLPKMWPEDCGSKDDAVDYADELLQLLGGSVDAAERRWG